MIENLLKRNNSSQDNYQAPSQGETSIIKVIQKMVRENEPEEKIISTLKSLNVNEDQAKRLLLIAQADTFTLLSSEINKMMKEELDIKKVELKNEITKYNIEEFNKEKDNYKKELKENMNLFRKDLEQNVKEIEDRNKETIQKIAQINDKLEIKTQENEKEILELKTNFDEAKLKGIKLKNTLSRTILTIFAIICFISAVAFIGLNFTIEFNFDFITSAIVLAFVGSIIIYFMTNI
ncbi:MAG: hypothetical protein PHQ98_02130 [Candidatus ainarchaeum sp.]|nr:hypothetical protein [Candidatus ainarchaeum sp.]